ncbi:MAG: hypothetical protein KGZ39_00725 [Simkania sp.]|nr:hypothetical protein [Simkania sp.]
MNGLKYGLVLFSMSTVGWCVPSEEALTECSSLEAGFLSLKEIGIHVFDRDEDTVVPQRISQEILEVFQAFGGVEHYVNYMSGPGELNVLLSKENDQYTVSLLLLGDRSSEDGLVFIDCFQVHQDELGAEIRKKVRNILADLASGGCYPTAFILE